MYQNNDDCAQRMVTRCQCNAAMSITVTNCWYNVAYIMYTLSDHSDYRLVHVVAVAYDMISTSIAACSNWLFLRFGHLYAWDLLFKLHWHLYAQKCLKYRKIKHCARRILCWFMAQTPWASGQYRNKAVHVCAILDYRIVHSDRIPMLNMWTSGGSRQGLKGQIWPLAPPNRKLAPPKLF